jgi:hypothetical protein
VGWHPDRVSESSGLLPFEIAVSHVSSFWRAVAVGTPSLWTRLLIHPAQSPQWIQVYLSRSKSCPLDMFFYGTVEPVTPAWNSLLKTMLLLVHRLRRLHVSGDTRFVYAMLSHYQMLAAPLLHEIFLHGSGQTHIIVPPLFTGGAPALSSMRLGDISMNSGLPPLSGITKMVLHNIASDGLWRVDRIHAVFSAAPSLVELSVHGPVVESPVMYTHARIKLQSLRSLWVSATQPEILILVEAPLIDFLSLSNIPITSEWVNIATYEPVAAIYHKIQTLVCAYTVPLHFAFHLYVSVTHFMVLHCNALRILDEMVCELFGADPPWPDLDTLTLYPFFNPGANNAVLEGTLRSLVSLRIKMGCPIRKLRLDANSLALFPPDSVERLNEQVEVEALAMAPTDDGMP